MIYSFGLCGTGVPVIKEFNTKKEMCAKRGRGAYIDSEGFVNGDGNGEFIGIFAEEHSGKKDILNLRADGNRVRVDITSGGVYKMPFPILEAGKDGTETSFSCNTSILKQGIQGELMMVYKASDSVNTDGVGTKRKITAVSVSEGVATITIENGGMPCKGDRYAFIPSIGSVGGLDESRSGYCPSSRGVPSLKVINCDENTLTLEARLGGGFFEK